MPKTLKFDTPWDSDYWMESNGFYCGFNMPKALASSKDNKGEELQHNLPEYNWRKSYLVDEYPACPTTWMKSEGKLASYFVPIKEGSGMWLDFNKNQNHTHHLAVVVSIQGVNAITGLACENPNLEQYIEYCPKHNKKFGPNRFCEECGFKWPKQNYLCTTSTPTGYLWLDGFRAANGAVCQYILTEKTMKGVASNIIGNKRVYAIGISFFLSKNVKQIPVRVNDYLDANSFNAPDLVMGDWNRCAYTVEPVGDQLLGASIDMDIVINDNTNNAPSASFISSSSSSSSSSPSKSTPMDFSNRVSGSSLGEDSIEVTQNQIKSYAKDPRATCKNISRRGAIPNVTPVRTKNIEIGAGASIRQVVYDDPEPLDFWREQPEAILTINYCLEEEAGKIIAKGKISKAGDPKGFLKDVPTGNIVKETVTA